MICILGALNILSKSPCFYLLLNSYVFDLLLMQEFSPNSLCGSPRNRCIEIYEAQWIGLTVSLYIYFFALSVHIFTFLLTKHSATSKPDRLGHSACYRSKVFFPHFYLLADWHEFLTRGMQYCLLWISSVSGVSLCVYMLQWLYALVIPTSIIFMYIVLHSFL